MSASNQVICEERFPQFSCLSNMVDILYHLYSEFSVTGAFKKFTFIYFDLAHFVWNQAVQCSTAWDLDAYRNLEKC